MRKIFILMSLLVSALALTISSVNAVQVQKEVVFSVNNYEMTPDSRTQIVTTNQPNLYVLLDEIYHNVVTETMTGEAINYYETTIKRNGVNHTLRVARRFHEPTNSNRYTLRITFNNNQVISFFVYDRPIVYSSDLNGGWSRNVDQNQMTTNQVSVFENPNDFLGVYAVTGLVEQDLETGENIDVSGDFSKIPPTSGTLKDAKDLSKVGYVYFSYDEHNLFNTYITINDTQYNLGKLELPGVAELNREPLSPGIYYTVGNKRYIYYEFADNKSSIPIHEQALAFIDDPEQVQGFRPFVEMNLTDGTYVFTDKLGLFTAYHDGPNGEAYADVVFPMDLDDVLAIEISYRYRWQYLWNFYTDWQNVNQVRIKDETVDTRTAWQSWSSLIYTFGPSGTGLYNEIASWFAPDTKGITRLNNLDDAYKTKYLNTINYAQTNRGKSTLTMDQVFLNDSSVYRVFLRTFNEPIYTGYEIHDDIAIVYVTYQYKGEIYHVDYEDIDNIGGGGTSDPFKDFENFMELFTNFTNFVSNIDWSNTFLVGAIIVGVIIILIILGPVISIIGLIFKGVGFGFKSIVNLFKFIFKIPGQIGKGLKTLFVPKKKPKRRYRT